MDGDQLSGSESRGSVLIDSRACFPYTPMLKKEDGRIDWNQTADHISRQVRALNPWPVAYTVFNGQKLSILRARAIDEAAGEYASGPPGKVTGVD